MAKPDDRGLGQAKRPSGQHTPVAGDQLAVVCHQARHSPAELGHAGSDLRNLGLAMDLCVLGIGAQLFDRPDLNLARRKDKIHGTGRSLAAGKAC